MGKCCSGYVCAVLLLFLLNIVELSIGAGISVYALWLGRNLYVSGRNYP